jgi:hypothetical protein
LVLVSKSSDCYRTLIASIRKGGKCPCPRCSVPKAELSQFGTPKDRIQRQSLARMDSKDKRRDVDMARRKIYKDKFSVTCKAVENVLKPESWVPTSVKPKLLDTSVENGWLISRPECILHPSSPI